MKSIKDLSFICEGKEFIYTSPITKHRTFGIIQDIIVTPVIFDSGHFSVNISFKSTNGVTYDFDKNFKIITGFDPEKADRALKFIEASKTWCAHHAAILDEYVRKKFNNEKTMLTADLDTAVDNSAQRVDNP